MGLNERIKSAFWEIKDEGFEVVFKRSFKPFVNEPLHFRDSRVCDAVKYHNEKWFHNEIIVRAEYATVEPQYAYAVDGLSTIIGASIRTRNNLPSPIPMLKAKLLGERKKLPKAILFDGSMGGNYFHLLSDVLHKLFLLEEHTSLDCPVLVGNAVWNKTFFQYLIKETKFSKYDWQLVEQPIQAEELWIARPLPYDKKYWCRTKELFIEKDVELEARNAIFINRKGTRHITNFKEIEPILSKHNISVVDPGSMNLNEQAQLFNSATHVIGIHGAGMTNMVFTNHQKVKALELCSSNRIGTQYYWLCTALGIDWDMMLGSEANPDQSFELNPEDFEKRVVEFLS
jgi:hypothetical protein